MIRGKAGRRANGERGSTLVELLAATAIMGTAVVALLTGMTTLFGSSAGNRQSTTAAIVVRDYAEALNVAVASAWCSTSYTVSYTPPTNYTVVPTFGGCPANNAATLQIQTVTIVATAPNGSTETVKTIVRKP
jgi:type II secretory pathway pseudopilin PulG